MQPKCIKVKTEAAKQGNKTVTEYANMLKNLWQKLDHNRCIETKCPKDVAILKNYIENDRVYDFLVGLNKKSRRSVMLEPQNMEGTQLWSLTKKPRHTREKCWKLHGKPTTSSKEWDYKGG
ncbi:hypothetical protein CK203_109658 [Vitis vinifera]|uniref:Retrotransposon gag domain-containing protein n=1 Tax=Vitis vinifera TaxID=29760 RepID=A0A438CF74_VITVI|nr:hypothetical protein CK203_109658 [Vitis vinifera]